MMNWSLAHVPDHLLLSELSAVASRERVALADVLAHIAEVDARRLYLPAAFPNMHAYCVGELRMSEDAAFKRIRAARAARDFPALFDMVADGRLHLTAVVLLAPDLTPSNASDLLAAAAHRTKAEIELLLAEQFPQPDSFDLMSDPDTAEDACSVAEIGASEAHVDHDDAPVDESAHSLAPEPVDAMAGSSAVQHEHSTPSVCRFTPSSSGRYLMHASVSRETHDKFRRLQALLSHAVPSGDVDEVMGRAFDAAIRELEKRRFSKDDQPADDSNVRPRRDRPSKNARHIPAEVRRAVHERDGGRCTFTSAKGCRCAETRFLQFDHIIPLARGGKSTVENLRLRCRAHNQYEAERMFGAGFMAEKRASARGTRSARSVTSAGTAGSATGAGSAARSHMRPTRTPANPPLPPEQEELVPWLRALGFTVQEARSGAAACATNPEGSLEERMKLALRSLAPRSARRVLPITTASA